jgi:Tol biopolymer transport system component
LLPLLCLCITSCRHEPITPEESRRCVPIAPGDGSIYITDTLNFRAPYYNPLNQDEICCVIQNGQTFTTNLVVLDRVTKSKKLLTSNVYYWPKWNINGLITYNGTDNNIRTVDVSTNTVTLLTSDGKSYNPEWSPDGKFIVYEKGNYVGLMNDDGTNDHLLCDSAHLRHPAWAPDGRKIAFLETVEDSASSIATVLIVYDTASQTFTTLGRSETPFQYGIGWFPNSNDLVWATADGLFLSSMQGKQVLLKESCNSSTYLFPSVSPDGKNIVACRTDAWLIGKNTVFDQTNIYIMNADGGDEKKLEF